MYGRELLLALQQRFQAVTVISLGQRMFTGAGTKELTDVLVASHFQERKAISGQLRYLHVESLSELQCSLESPGNFTASIHSPPPKLPTSRSVALNIEQMRALDSIQSLPHCRRLGDLVKLKIGIVTGASNFFIFRGASLKKHQLLDSDCAVVISKFRHTSGISLIDSDVQRLRASDERVLLIKCSQRRMSQRVKRYLQTFPPDLRDHVVTFRKREPWYNLDDREIADAFLPSLVSDSPRLVLNYARLNCTNNVLRVWYHGKRKKLLKALVAVAITSTYGQLAIEVSGRACGCGGLKIEPSDWLNVKLLLPDAVKPSELSTAFIAIDKLLRGGRSDEARQCADRFLLERMPALRGIPQGNLHLADALNKLQSNQR